MTAFTQKTFTVKTGARPERDCEVQGHWPRSVKTGYECTFCGKACTRDGRTLETGK